MGFNIDQYEKIKAQLPREVLLLPVSKTKPVSDLMEAYNHGVKVFGENYVQELVAKAEEMPKDIEWHFIGHLQSNKVKYIAPFVKMIHGVDSFSLLKEIAKQARKQGRVIEVLLQFHIATEESKFGWSPEDLDAIALELKNNALEGVEICGVMGMASFVDHEQTIRKEFRQLKQCFDVLQPLLSERFRVISMGMSCDWPMAVEEGSTLIRLGSVLFGSRN
jgi:pyridoxal phosphate enzyme (YggS family)